jgi:hypothetical protein
MLATARHHINMPIRHFEQDACGTTASELGDVRIGLVAYACNDLFWRNLSEIAVEIACVEYYLPDFLGNLERLAGRIYVTSTRQVAMR